MRLFSLKLVGSYLEIKISEKFHRYLEKAKVTETVTTLTWSLEGVKVYVLDPEEKAKLKELGFSPYDGLSFLSLSPFLVVGAFPGTKVKVYNNALVGRYFYILRKNYKKFERLDEYISKFLGEEGQR